MALVPVGAPSRPELALRLRPAPEEVRQPYPRPSTRRDDASVRVGEHQASASKKGVGNR